MLRDHGLTAFHPSRGRGMTSARRHREMALARLRTAMSSDARPTPFIGAGVASAVTDGAACASWHGLLLDGIDQCRQSVPLPPGWADRMKEHLASADAISYMTVAEEIRSRLEAQAEGRDFGSWLQESVGSLTPIGKGWELLSTVRRLGDVIITTNYDTLLEKEGPQPALHEKWDAFTWTDDQWPSALQKARVVLHLHGMAAKPKSVILSSADYERIHNDQLDQAVNQYNFLSRRFLYIGCGDGLSDPHIAPLMRKAIEVLTARKRQQGQQGQEDREHFILVRGGELRQLIANPLPGSISPVAYGAEFDQLTDFLRKLGAGLDLDVSQDPDDYEPIGSEVSAAALGPSGWVDEMGRPARPAARSAASERGADPPVTTLSQQVLADRQVQEALTAVRRAARAMDRVAACVALPIGMTTWEPEDQQAVHEQLAVSATGPVASLNDRLREAADGAAAAADQVARSAVQAEPGSALPPARVAPTAAALEALSAELAKRVTLAHHDLAKRSITSSIRYRLLLPALAEAQAEAGDTRRVAAELRQRLDWRLTRGGPRRRAGQPGAGAAGTEPAGAAEPDPHARPSRQAEAPAAPVTVTELTAPFLQPEAAVAAGPGTDRELHDEESVPVPSDLVGKKVIVMRVTGESMAGDDIHNGYYLVVDTQRNIGANEIAVFEKEGPAAARGSSSGSLPANTRLTTVHLALATRRAR